MTIEAIEARLAAAIADDLVVRLGPNGRTGPMFELIAHAPDDLRALLAIARAAREVMAEWDALGPTGTSSTLTSHRNLRAALDRLDAE